MRMKQLLPILLLLGSLLSHLHAQEKNINLIALSTKDGLSSNTVNTVLKDKYGWVWVGTDDGLARFDGTNFTIYRHHPNRRGSIKANEILSLHEDKKGTLWIGTSGGSVGRYDRKRDQFEHFPTAPGEHNINNNVIRSIISDYTGKIWIGHFNGVTLLDPETDKTSALPIARNSPVTTVKSPPLCLFEDSHKKMWLGTTNGVYKYDPKDKSLHFVNLPVRKYGTQYPESINVILEDLDGALWIGTSKGLYRSKKEEADFKIYPLNENPANGQRNLAVNAIGLDSTKLWIGTSEGLEIIDLITGSETSYRKDNRNIHSLTAKQIKCITIDKQGIYWIGTVGGGLNKYDRNLNLFNYVKNNPFDNKGLQDPIVKCFVENPNGTIFVGTEGSGLSLFNPTTKLFTRIPIPSRRGGPNGEIDVLELKTSRTGKILIGTYGDGLISLDPRTNTFKKVLAGTNPAELNANEIFSITCLKNGEIWTGTNGYGINILNAQLQVIKRFTPNPVLPNDSLLPLNGYIREMLEDKDGDIWVGTHGGGIARYNPDSQRFTIYNNTNSGLPNNKIQTLWEDPEGNIWMGTFGSGVVRYSKKNNSFQAYSEKEGLQNSMAYELIGDDKGMIWVSTNTGISSIDPVTNTITNYNHYNGIQQNNFVRGSGLKLSTGEIYFGGKEGFNYFNPADLIINRNIPAVVLTELRISNLSVDPSEDGPITDHISVAEEINLAYKQNFALDFVALNYTSPQQNRYAYQLDGFDKSWNEVGNNTTASYTNLDPGTYTFRVKASNNDGIWNETGRTIKVIVHPPFWRSAYAYILYFLLIAGSLFYSRYTSIQKWKRKFAMEQERVKAEQEKREVERMLELDRLKIKFLTNLSHEFRTPISLILGPVETLLQKESNSGLFKQLQLVKHNARRLLNLVNQLLDFRKMEEQELKLNPTEGNLVPFVEEISQAFKDLAERKKIGFSYTGLIDKLYTQFDHDKLERILFNILSNAFKFTNKGGSVHMSLAWSNKTTADQPWVEISITDTGIGIPAEQKEKIFDLFFQHPTSAAILNQGTGIGLSITKEFVKMHGGLIEVESLQGKGTSFSIHLPLLPLESPIEESEQMEPEYSEDQQPVIESAKPAQYQKTGLLELPSLLLVEDNDDFRFYLKDNLRLHYKVFEAVNGKEGWQKALTHHPQLIVSDISMPEMDGIQLCQKLKADKRTQHIPIILLTALTGEDDQLTGLKTGANDYITKPFNFELLNAKIKNLLVLNDTLKLTYSKQIKALAPDIEIQSADEKLLQTILKYLDENLNNSQLSVEELSKQIGMSRSSLYTKLLELTGQTPVEFIRSIKLEKAAVLLEKSDMNIAEIAYSVGFSTPNYFAKSFKTKFNMLPSEYILQVRKVNS